MERKKNNKTVAQSTVVVLHETIPCLFFRCDKMARERLKLGKKRTIRMGVFYACVCVNNSVRAKQDFQEALAIK